MIGEPTYCLLVQEPNGSQKNLIKTKILIRSSLAHAFVRDKYTRLGRGVLL